MRPFGDNRCCIYFLWIQLLLSVRTSCSWPKIRIFCILNNLSIIGVLSRQCSINSSCRSFCNLCGLRVWIWIVRCTPCLPSFLISASLKKDGVCYVCGLYLLINRLRHRARVLLYQFDSTILCIKIGLDRLKLVYRIWNLILEGSCIVFSSRYLSIAFVSFWKPTVFFEKLGDLLRWWRCLIGCRNRVEKLTRSIWYGLNFWPPLTLLDLNLVLKLVKISFSMAVTKLKSNFFECFKNQAWLC